MIVGVVGNPRYPDLRGLLTTLATAAPRLGLELQSEPELAAWWPAPVPALNHGGKTPDLLLAMGGDGTLLRGARLLGHAVPVLGVNLGRVGFLTSATPQSFAEALDAVAAGSYELEPRRMVDATIVTKNGTERSRALALNDVVVHKSGVARVIQVKVAVDAEEISQYSADGIIVATPTGSTAYSLSAGGPVVVPGVNALVVTAISPHTLAVRPIVVPGTATVTIEVLPPWGEDVLVSYDGQMGTTLKPDERVVVRQAASPVRLVRLGKEGFFGRMRRKLKWGDLSDRERA